MPITQSAKKALRSSRRRRILNERRKRAMKEAVKNVRKSLSDPAAAEKLRAAYQAIDKAAKRGVIKKNAAARKKSRLAKALAQAT